MESVLSLTNNLCLSGSKNNYAPTRIKYPAVLSMSRLSRYSTGTWNQQISVSSKKFIKEQLLNKFHGSCNDVSQIYKTIKAFNEDKIE